MLLFPNCRTSRLVLLIFFCIPILLSLSCEGENSQGGEFRRMDGSRNNVKEPAMNSIFVVLSRIVNPDYSDGISQMAGNDRPGPREISNAVVSQEVSIHNTLGTSDYIWQWGQFLDHDLDLTPSNETGEEANIQVPQGDVYFDPFGTGLVEIGFNRSVYDTATGTDISNPRQQLNEITGWIDASNVYGSDDERAFALRTNDGTGMLKTSDGNLLPFNTDGLPNDGGPDPSLFLAGDTRANEQVGLTAMHTLFVREHNRLAAQIAAENPDFNGERIYQEARKIVAAEMQFITYNEFLPALLGPGAVSDYSGYDPDLNASVFSIFSTAAYRFGHSALSPEILRLDSAGSEIPEGNLPLQDAFFSPSIITDEGGIEPILRGLASQLHQRIDSMIVDDVRNFLFGPPGSGGLDLASLNIQRGRDHGLPSYNDTREQLGLERAQDFTDVTSDPVTQSRLSSVYGSVDEIDLWVGGLSEDPLPGSHLGEVFTAIIRLQFEVLRDGDRFWYEIYLDEDEIEHVESSTLANIIKRNTNIGEEMQDNVFFAE